MTSHTEASDRLIGAVDREVRRYNFRQLMVYVKKHSEVFLGDIRSSVNVVAGRFSKLPVLVNVRNACFSGTSIREYAGNPMLLSKRSEPRFNCKIFMSRSHTTKAVECRERFSSLVFYLILRNINTKGHFSLNCLTPVTYNLI
jgi:hypothetical protein